ncbi:hypothetical protein N0V90_013117 [Kalmusia sp. IMI 367209]|nr:hypothetical protein N0V90_013117 [Kalmusia sp. IMI 367209]
MATAEALDDDISDLRAKIAILQAHRANLTSILLSQPHLPARLEQHPVAHEGSRRNATKLVKQQSIRNLENVYRACAGVTAYKVKDPDPCAVDNGNVLGVRIEVSIDGSFIDTYHVLFNRPNAARRNMLKIHKHTIPPCIPLQPLANKWLPMTRKDAEITTEQNLVKFGKHLRRELVSWHMRLRAVETLRKEAGLRDQPVQQEPSNSELPIGTVLNAFVSEDEDSEEEDRSSAQDGATKLTNIEADAAVREITLAWSNGRVGVIKVTKDGEIDKAVVRAEDGTRDASLSRKAIGRIEELVQRLTA